MAIKCAFKKSNSFTLEHEYKLVNGLQHPNIAHFLAYHQYNLEGIGVVEYLIMRYYEYGNLDVFLAERNPDLISQDRLLRGILEGLAFLHQKGLIHREMYSSSAREAYLFPN